MIFMFLMTYITWVTFSTAREPKTTTTTKTHETQNRSEGSQFWHWGCAFVFFFFSFLIKVIDIWATTLVRLVKIIWTLQNTQLCISLYNSLSSLVWDFELFQLNVPFNPIQNIMQREDKTFLFVLSLLYIFQTYTPIFLATFLIKKRFNKNSVKKVNRRNTK